jgi:YggT family protein
LESSLLPAIGNVFWYAVQVYIWIVIIAALISWFSPSQQSPFVRLLDSLTAPALRLTRRVARMSFGGLDFSPLLLILFLYFVGGVVRLSCLSIGSGAKAMVIFPVIVICLLQLIKSLCWFIIILMVIRAVMSLIQPSPYNFLVLVVYGATEPLLSPLRSLVPKGPWNLDLKAVLFLAFLLLFEVLVLNNLLGAAAGWGLRYGMPRL